MKERIRKKCEKNSRKEERNRWKKIRRINQNTSKRKAGRVEKEGRKVEGLKESKKRRELSRQDRKRRKMEGIKVFPDLLIHSCSFELLHAAYFCVKGRNFFSKLPFFILVNFFFFLAFFSPSCFKCYQSWPKYWYIKGIKDTGNSFTRSY